MNKKVTVGISNRHVHLTKEIYEYLFDEEISMKYKLNQGDDFAANQTVMIKSAKGKFDNVRIIGPFRDYNQVEISKSDAYVLGLNPPVRGSGDLENSETITIEYNNKSIELKNSCIISNRHVHMNPKKAMELGVTNNELVKVAIPGDKSAIVDAYIKITEKGYFEIHVDRDDANSLLLNNNDEVEIIL